LERLVPIYEYRCSSCGFQKEYLQKVSAPLLSVCPECSKATFGKMLTAAGFQLKGGGWYATDFKNSGARPAAKSADQSGTESKNTAAGESKGDGKSDGNSESKGKSESKSDGKSDSKSDSKTEARPAAAAAPAAGASAAKAE
jgi:putative FmdB family regulatory protein